MVTKSFAPIIETIEEDYEIPHLNATRKISALLPYDYYDSKKHYPVLYLQDGQNLFNPSAPFGDWAIDKTLEKLSTEGLKDIVIIAVDHGEKERILEYLPYFNHRFGQGKGKHYVAFMREKLMPYVNRKYRIHDHFSQIGIGGSSMGGLISLYAGLAHPDIFGKMMIFSPSLWISKIIYYQTQSFKPKPGSKTFLYAGGKESLDHLPNVEELQRLLSKKSKDYPFYQLKTVINMDGEHKEIYWKEQFPEAVKYLFFNRL